MLGRVVDFARAGIADFANRGFEIAERTHAGHDHAHAGDKEFEPSACPAAVWALTLCGNRRIMRRDVEVHMSVPEARTSPAHP